MPRKPKQKVIITITDSKPGYVHSQIVFKPMLTKDSPQSLAMQIGAEFIKFIADNSKKP